MDIKILTIDALIPIGNGSQYLLISVALSYGWVPLTTVYVFTAEQAATNAVKPKNPKSVFWPTRAMLTAKHAATSVFLLKRKHALFEEGLFCLKLNNIFVNVCQYLQIFTNIR